MPSWIPPIDGMSLSSKQGHDALRRKQKPFPHEMARDILRLHPSFNLDFFSIFFCFLTIDSGFVLRNKIEWIA